MSTSTTTAPTASTSTLTTSEAEALKASVFQRLHPRIYYERFLEERVRPDGREFDAWRDVAVNVGSISTADGSSLVRLGDTTIVCGVKAEIAQPDLDSPEDGFIVPNVDLPAICSPKFKPGPPTEEAQVLSDRLNEVLTAHDVLPTSSLIIHPGKAAWVLYIDATCINYDGNAFDATLIAMIAALKSTRLPRTKYDEDTGKVICSRHDRVPLTLTNLPIAMSFGVFNGDTIMSDLTSFEEPLMDTNVTVILGQDGGVLSVTQAGMGGGEALVDSCIASASKRRSFLAEYIYE
ncbi:ribosomal protein S5 domain 2-type protein [Schizophyllum commune]